MVSRAKQQAIDFHYNRLRLLCATHEAGHTVAGWFYGAVIRSVELFDYDRGECFFNHPGLNPYRQEMVSEEVKAAILISLAGIAAKGKKALEIGADYMFDTVGGREDCVTTAARLFLIDPNCLEGSEEVETFFLQYGREAREYVRRADVWPAIEAVANALLEHKKLTGQQAVRIILQSWGDRPLPEKALPLKQHGR